MTTSPVSADQVLLAAKVVDVSVANLPLSRAIASAQKHFNRRNTNGRPATLDSDPHFLERITVNYLRHVCSNYDAHRDFLQRIDDPKVRARAGAIIKGRQLAEIARCYPELAAEARRQARREDNKSQPVG